MKYVVITFTGWTCPNMSHCVTKIIINQYEDIIRFRLILNGTLIAKNNWLYQFQSKIVYNIVLGHCLTTYQCRRDIIRKTVYYSPQNSVLGIVYSE